MGKERLESSLESYEDISIEAYYSDNIDRELRQYLNQEMEDAYVEKYSPKILSSEATPIMNIETEGEKALLIGDEISVEAINQVLKP